eukprot:7990826-Prorocentrum_lima.AAC.1
MLRRYAKRDAAGSPSTDLEDFWKTFQALLHSSIAEMIWSGLGHTTSGKAVPSPAEEAAGAAAASDVEM